MTHVAGVCEMPGCGVPVPDGKVETDGKIYCPDEAEI